MHSLDPLRTPRLVLLPISDDAARRFLASNFSSVTPAEGWPHADTFDGLRIAVEQGYPAGWMVLLDTAVIGDCGIHGPADAAGVIEIGYGLAAPHRGRGYGTEIVAALTEWLLTQPGISAVEARTLADNMASRLVLEKNGFSRVGFDDEGQTVYRRDRD